VDGKRVRLGIYQFNASQDATSEEGLEVEDRDGHKDYYWDTKAISETRCTININYKLV